MRFHLRTYILPFPLQSQLHFFVFIMRPPRKAGERKSCVADMVITRLIIDFLTFMSGDIIQDIIL